MPTFAKNAKLALGAPKMSLTQHIGHTLPAA